MEITSELHSFALSFSESVRIFNSAFRANRKLRTKIVRQMCCWSHYGFRETLKIQSCSLSMVQTDSSRRSVHLKYLPCLRDHQQKAWRGTKPSSVLAVGTVAISMHLIASHNQRESLLLSAGFSYPATSFSTLRNLFHAVQPSAKCCVENADL